MDITQSHEGIVDNFLASKESQDFFVENEAKEEAIRRKIKKSKYKYRAHALVSVLLMGLMLWKGFNGM